MDGLRGVREGEDILVSVSGYVRERLCVEQNLCAHVVLSVCVSLKSETKDLFHVCLCGEGYTGTIRNRSISGYMPADAALPWKTFLRRPPYSHRSVAIG